MQRAFAILLGLTILVSQVHAQEEQRAKTSNYEIPSDVVSSGGGDKAHSTNYLLDDTIGEANIGFGRSANYDVNAGYRQPSGGTYLAMTCAGPISMGTIVYSGQVTGSGTCVITTDNEAGYSLNWQITTGSGGTNTGYLISHRDIIAPLHPTVAGTPQTWSVASNDARWGGRLSSRSDDTDTKWGTDGSSDKWLNVGTGSYTMVSRSTRTAVAGSTEIVQYRTEIGATKSQPNGTYQATIVYTASAL